MAKPVQFPEQNSVLTGNGDVADLHVFRDGDQVISKWVLSPSEMMEVMATGALWLQIKGQTHAPAKVTGEYPFERTAN